MKTIRKTISGVIMSAMLALCALTGCTAGSSPTLPIPPPSALSSTPDGDGIATITGTGAVPGALIAAYNEQREDGVLGTADEEGDFSVRLRAEVGDDITVWQQIGTRSSELLSIQVPGP